MTRLGAHKRWDTHNDDSELSNVVSCVMTQLKVGVEEALKIARPRLGNNELDQYFAAGLHETRCLEILDKADHDVVRSQQSHDEKVGMDKEAFSRDYVAMMTQHVQSKPRGRRPKALLHFLIGVGAVVYMLCT